MNWQTLQQLIRIVLYSIGSAIFGSQIADGELFQAAIGGLVSVSAFAWWFVAERLKRKLEGIKP